MPPGARRPHRRRRPSVRPLPIGIKEMTKGIPVLDVMRASDWREVRAIYAEGIATGDATFETRPPGWMAWHAAHLPCCRLVAQDGESLLGWAALSSVSERCMYGGVAEVSAYVAGRARGKGVRGASLEFDRRIREERHLDVCIFFQRTATLVDASLSRFGPLSAGSSRSFRSRRSYPWPWTISLGHSPAMQAV